MKKNVFALVIGIALAFGMIIGFVGGKAFGNEAAEEINAPKEGYVEVYMGPEEGWVEVPEWLVVEVNELN